MPERRVRPSMRTAVLIVARARVRRYWVAIVVVGLVAALGGAGVLALVAGARRTETAYERLRTATRAFDGRVLLLEPVGGSADKVTRLRLLPQVGESTVARFRVGRRADTKDWVSTVSLPALDAAASRPQIVRGRSFRIGNPNEAVLSQSTARAMHLDVGDTLPIDFYADRQVAAVLDDYFVPPAGGSVRLRVVGITRDPDDASGGRTVLAGPALLADSERTAGFAGILFRLAPGATRASTERAIDRLDLGSESPDLIWAADTAQALDNTRNAIVGGLLVAAVVLGLATLVAVGQAAGRHLDQVADETDALRALGLTMPQRIAASTVPSALAAVVAVIGAAVGAIVLSPVFPTGRIRDFEPHPGVAVHLVVLGLGLVALAGLVLAAFLFAAWRTERRAASTAGGGYRRHHGPVAHRWSLGPTTLIGARFALERGAPRRAVPVRTSLVGIAIGVAGVVGALTFASSLQGFIEEPAHYGQPFDLSIETLGSRGAPGLLAGDPAVAAAAVVRSVDATIDGHRTTVNTVRRLKGTLGPTLESGRPATHADEIVLGPKLLTAVGARVGDDVTVRGATTRRLRVVGTALNLDPQDESFGTTAYVNPAVLRALGGTRPATNEETALRFRSGADVAAATQRLKAAIPYGLTDESHPSRPAPVANVAELGGLPQTLAVVLATIGMIAVAHAVVLAVRRRRSDLAILAALGMTRGQRARIVVTMATTMVAIGLAIGIPVGIGLGSYVWNLLARGLHVEWSPVVPAPAIVAVAVGAIAATIVFALVPARTASRVRPARVLRTG